MDKAMFDAHSLANKRTSEIYEAAEKARKKYPDIGAYAAALGYDAINAVNHGKSGSYTVILNRTKTIFLEDYSHVDAENEEGPVTFQMGPDGVLWAIRGKEVVGWIIAQECPEDARKNSR